MSWTKYFDISFVPDGKKGPWTVSRFVIREKDAKVYNLSLLFGGHGSRQVEPGEYVRLSHAKRGVVMSTTPAETRDHLAPWQEARGRCLINGLGLGMITAACLRKKEVEHVTVVEKDPDVVGLIAPALFKEFDQARLSIACADALEWRPEKGERFGMVWHDIWDTISVDNKPEMSKLHRRYGRLADWQGSWGKWDIERMMAEDRRYARPW